MKQYDNLDADQLALILEDLDKSRLAIREEAKYVKQLLDKKLAQKELDRLAKQHGPKIAALRARAGIVETGVEAKDR